MKLRNFQFGWQICEKLNIQLQELAELCHAGRLAAYHFDEGRQILASSQCSTRFKYPGNTTFTITPSNTNAIIAISKKAVEDFSVYVDRKINSPEKQDIDWRSENNSIGKSLHDVLIAMDQQRLKNIKEMRIKFGDGEYIVYCNALMNSPFRLDIIYVYKNEKIFFELKGQESEISLEYLELNRDDNCRVLNKEHCGGIKKCITNLCIKKDQDSFGNVKYVLSEYDSNVIQIVYEDNFLNIKRNNISNGYNKRELFDIDIYQHSVDYFNKECLSYSKPLNHEKDFFIFDYDEYKIRFHFFEDEEKVRKGFFNYINKLMFDENQIHNVLEYDIAKKSISDDPKQYMLDHCKKLKEIYKNDKEILMIVEAYMLALEGFKWAVIDEKLWDHSKDVDNSRTFVSRKLKIFEKIAADNRIPFIAAVRWKNVNNKESIVEDMLKQLKAFHADA